ncbi:MAG: hypothetical protein H6R02_3179, partial [Burkholderiaceae bacterium]|nr:hypothetical protein [Burkholderiaceae bacterium]
MDTRNEDRSGVSELTGEQITSTRAPSCPMRDAAIEAWRRERLYLFLFWLERRDRSPFNFVGGWHSADLGDEAARWKEALAGLDHDAALELVDRELSLRFGRELSLRFGKTWQQAVLEGASPRLARANLPIWNEATSSLLPAHLGAMTIFRAESYAGKPTLGWSYNYGCSGSSEKVSITLYSRGQTELLDGLSDPRLPNEIGAAWMDVRGKISVSGGHVLDASVLGPGEESLLDRYNRRVVLLSIQGQAVDADQRACFEALCMRVFRGQFLKVRYTRRAGPEAGCSGR